MSPSRSRQSPLPVKCPLLPPLKPTNGNPSQSVFSYQYCRRTSTPATIKCLPLEMLKLSENPAVQRLMPLKFWALIGKPRVLWYPPLMPKVSIEQGVVGVGRQ